ncbi:MAG: chromosome segregation protein SMC [Anaerocolumna sp.]
MEVLRRGNDGGSMYLKNIEVHGFKSFANKINFVFEDGITGIVGPNGSGKSNVADAVRWVLGEQSAKQLRGAKMEDVIFSGTEMKKPMGYAYVAITISNEDHKLPVDYEEVTVARRVYRSGESEYLMNGNNCRLRDVQELFMDTGIGKEGYSIIGQGQIDKILSGKPEDRRELFDEAAGIMKFKKRKQTALHNLEQEKLNLSRVNDILSEIELQIGPLEAQSGIAKEYLKLRDELRILDVNLFLMENNTLKENKQRTEENLKSVNETLQGASTQFAKIKEEFDKVELQIEEQNIELESNKNIVNQFKLDKEKMEGSVKVLKEQIVSLKQNEVHITSRKGNIERELSERNEELKKFVQDKEELNTRFNHLDEKQIEVSSNLEELRTNIRGITKEIEALNGDIFEALSSNSTLKGNIQRYETILEQNNLKKVELNQKILRNKSEEAVLDLEIEEQRVSLEEIEGTINLSTQSNLEVETKIAELSKEMEVNEIQTSRKMQEFHREESRLESLRNLTERYEGYGNSIKKVMEKKDITGVIGVVADIIKVESKYEIAIETALGGSIQNIVTDNEETAKALIQYLKQGKFGRATFLPLTSVTGKDVMSYDKYLSEPGVLGVASKLVKTEDRFAGLVTNLLGRSLVVDHIDNALKLARKFNYSLRIITLEGELLSSGGSLSGGAYKNASNLLGRRREIEELESLILNLQKEIAKLNEGKVLMKEARMAKMSFLENEKKLLQEAYISQNTIKMKLNQLLKQKQDGIIIYEEITNEIKEIEKQSIELSSNLTSLEAELSANLQKSNDNEIMIDEKSKLLEKHKEQEQMYVEKDAAIRIDFSALEQRNQNILENIKRVKKEMEKLYEEENSLSKDITESLNAVHFKEEQIETTFKSIEILQTDITFLEESITKETFKKDELLKEHKNFFSKRETLSVEITNLDKESFRLSSQLEKLTEQIDERINYMWEEYELTYHNALEYKWELEEDASSVKKKIGNVKNTIKALGDVNINAIEDFKNLSERYIFLKTQRDDLERAEDALIAIITELDEEMRSQFNLKFKEIREQFDLVFKELFGGGKATLELTQEEDVLEAGIVITSQPPGKKLQNMMQLSGGEKALTAISLLFAIQNLKPSPFCLLDEIEAALDDANVKRFAKYLHKLTKHTQFIIITHRRGTMNAADVLYGITMQEKGVSTLVSVNLIENDLGK